MNLQIEKDEFKDELWLEDFDFVWLPSIIRPKFTMKPAATLASGLHLHPFHKQCKFRENCSDMNSHNAGYSKEHK